MLPCTEIECLVFPICRMKTHVYCTTLHEFVWNRGASSPHFPNLIMLGRDHGNGIRLTIHRKEDVSVEASV